MKFENEEEYFAFLFAPVKTSSEEVQKNINPEVSTSVPEANVDLLTTLGFAHDPQHITLEEEINLLRQQRQNPQPTLPPVAVIKSDHKVVPSLPSAPIIDEYEEADFGDAYDDYVPSKLGFGLKHPDPVVESSSLSVVAPPDIKYKLVLPESIIKNGLLSSLQLESLVYACQKHEDFLPDGSRAGYLIGDGPGVGKGRIIAGIIYENMIRKRKQAVWVSVSTDLRYDAYRDLEDIGCLVQVTSIGKISYAEKIEEIFEDDNIGVLFCTYSSLIGETSSIDNLYRSRLEQIMDWLTPNFDGLIIFDECHKAKNLLPSGSSKPTKTAQCVLKLQNILPKARIIYCSATGATEPRNMAYMTRLGLWGKGTPFLEFESFLSAVDKRGVGAMELVAIDLKQRGVYLARQLSFAGVSFSVLEVNLSENFKNVYDESVKIWELAQVYFEKASDLLCYSSKDRSFLMAQFFSSHQRFFKALCIASKVDSVVQIVKKALSDKKAVIIGLQSTGESKTSELSKDQTIDRIVSTAHGILHALVSRHFPTGINPFKNNSDKVGSDSSDEAIGLVDLLSGTKRKLTERNDIKTQNNNEFSYNRENSALAASGIRTNKYDWSNYPSKSDANIQTPSPTEKCKSMRNELLSKIEFLRDKLPENTLDLLIDRLGGPHCVAEMTGRKGRIVRVGSQKFVFESRASDDVPLELVNVAERDEFMDGRKLIAIISEAASSGISLQSDRRVKNTRKRLHITLELSWSADRAVQQFGRSHRSNQSSPPEYLFVISELAGEKRFACVVAKRLESLGALTHGDRRASETRDLSQFNIDTKYGRLALDKMCDLLQGRSPLFVELPESKGDFISEASNVVSTLFKSDYTRTNENNKDKDSLKIHKFLNRLLGVRVDLQNAIYSFYTSILDQFVKDAKSSGKYDFGIVDFGIGNDVIYVKERKEFLFKSSSGSAIAELVCLDVARGIFFEDALKLLSFSSDPESGFYISKGNIMNSSQCMLVLPSSSIKSSIIKYTATRPNTGCSKKAEPLETLTKNYVRISPNLMADHWNRFYTSTYHSCIHVALHGTCRTLQRQGHCDVGKRVRTVHLLCGAIFSLWNIIENTFGNSPIRMARVTTQDKERHIGIIVPSLFVPRLSSLLERAKLSCI